MKYFQENVTLSPLIHFNKWCPERWTELLTVKEDAEQRGYHTLYNSMPVVRLPNVASN
jgi:hypothetical protein